MNKRIQELAERAFEPINAMSSEGVADRYIFDQKWFQLYSEKLANLVVQECADMIREKYDNANAEVISWNLELEFGLHGDYAE